MSDDEITPVQTTLGEVIQRINAQSDGQEGDPLSQAAVVCQHLLRSTGRPRLGFFQPAHMSPDRTCGHQAWCKLCDDMVLSQGDWTDEATEFARPTVVCLEDYLKRQAVHAFRLWARFKARWMLWRLAKRRRRKPILTQSCQTDEFIEEYTEAIRLNPSDAAAYNNRGKRYAEKGDYNRAIADFSEAVRLDPTDAIAYFNRGYVWDEKGEGDKAIADYSDAIRLKPDFAIAYNNRGITRKKMREYDKAIADYSEALRIDPNNTLALVNRGTVWREIGGYGKAITDLREVLRLDPNDAAVCNALAWIQATCPDRQYRDGKAAVANAKRAQDLAPGAWEPLETLAAAYAEVNQWDEAVQCQAKAVELAPERERKQSQLRLGRYKQRTPYREEPRMR